MAERVMGLNHTSRSTRAAAPDLLQQAQQNNRLRRAFDTADWPTADALCDAGAQFKGDRVEWWLASVRVGYPTEQAWAWLEAQRKTLTPDELGTVLTKVIRMAQWEKVDALLARGAPRCFPSGADRNEGWFAVILGDAHPQVAVSLQRLRAHGLEVGLIPGPSGTFAYLCETGRADAADILPSLLRMGLDVTSIAFGEPLAPDQIPLAPGAPYPSHTGGTAFHTLCRSAWRYRFQPAAFVGLWQGLLEAGVALDVKDRCGMTPRAMLAHLGQSGLLASLASLKVAAAIVEKAQHRHPGARAPSRRPRG
jgi:hypothetical protein